MRVDDRPGERLTVWTFLFRSFAERGLPGWVPSHGNGERLIWAGGCGRACTHRGEGVTVEAHRLRPDEVRAFGKAGIEAPRLMVVTHRPEMRELEVWLCTDLEATWLLGYLAGISPMQKAA